MTKNPENYLRILHYLTCIDENSHNEKLSIKYNAGQLSARYPFMISEIFSAENAGLIDFLFDAANQKIEEEEEAKGQLSQEHEAIRKSLLPKLFSFLEQDALNVTASGYFAKTLSPIIRRRGYSVTPLHPITLSSGSSSRRTPGSSPTSSSTSTSTTSQTSSKGSFSLTPRRTSPTTTLPIQYLPS